MSKKIESMNTHDEVIAHRQSVFGKYDVYIPQFVYGGIDGAVTTFAVVAASAGAELGTGVVIIMGLSNMLADGLSMSIGSFLSTKSEVERYEHIKNQEYVETKQFPEAETQEIRDIYGQKGFEGDLLEKIVTHIVSKKDLWVEEMMVGEHGLLKEETHPLSNGFMTFVSFCVLGFIPVSPYVYAYLTETELPDAFLIACLSTAIAFVLIGFLKGLVTQANRIKAIMETLLLGGIAAGAAYGVGDWLEKLISVSG